MNYSNIQITINSNTTILYWNKYWSLFLLAIPIFTLIGNLVVVIAIINEKSLRTTTNYFILSLSIADVSLSIFVMPLYIWMELNEKRWNMGVVLCDALIVADVTFCTASIFNLTSISIDRFLAVTKPLSYSRHNTNRVPVMIFLSWLISFLTALPMACGINHSRHIENKKQHNNTNPILILTTFKPINNSNYQFNECTFHNTDFIIYSSLISFYIPAIITIFLYYKIFLVIKKRHFYRSSQQCHSKTIIKSEQIEQLDDNHQYIYKNKNILKTITISSSSSSNKSEKFQANIYNNNFLSPNYGVGNKNFFKRSRASSEDTYNMTIINPHVKYDRNSKRNMSTFSDVNHSLLLKSPQINQLSVSQSNLQQFYNNELSVQRQVSNHRFHQASQREKKVTKTLAIVIGVFLICWLPYFSVNLLLGISTKLEWTKCQDILVKMYSTVTWLGYVNSVMNPIIYTTFNTEFRYAFRKIIRCSFCK